MRPTQIQPIDFMPANGNIQAILPPASLTVFAKRAQRFLQLAEGHPLGDWLGYLSQLTQRQHDILDSLAPLALPDAALIEQAIQHRMPPLNAASLARPVLWHGVLHQLIDGLISTTPADNQTRLKMLRNTPVAKLEALATDLLNGHPNPADLPDLPYVAAALQIVWTAWAAQIAPASLALLDAPELCPCCGSLPVASIVRTTADTTQVNNLRYLHCSLCNTEWNLPRAVCTACATDKSISYQQIEGSNSAVRAECCDACHSYLKLLVQEKDDGVDPVADDLATLALDVLVDEAGYSRSGPNLLLLGGAG